LNVGKDEHSQEKHCSIVEGGDIGVGGWAAEGDPQSKKKQLVCARLPGVRVSPIEKILKWKRGKSRLTNVHAREAILDEKGFCQRHEFVPGTFPKRMKKDRGGGKRQVRRARMGLEE